MHDKAIWMPLRLANTWFFFKNRLAKWFLFQLIMLIVKSFRQFLEPREGGGKRCYKSRGIQLFSTSVEKEGLVSHICSNLKILVDLQVRGSESNNIEQWLDLVRRRCWISDLRNKSFHYVLSKPLSNLSLMLRCQIRFLLVQVNLGPWKPKSIRPQKSIQSLKAFNLYLLRGSSPIFLSSASISLKSLKRTHGILIIGDKSFK